MATTNGTVPNDNEGDIFAGPEEKEEFNGKVYVPPTERTTPSWLQTLASVGGNVLEWYDFAVFGFFTDIIGKVFFPPQSGHAAIIESFVVFGGAFIMRPIGGMLMGYVGDKVGRKTALEISIFLMAVPTFAMGCLPTYRQVGWFSIILLVLVRLLQGLSVGGQLMSSLVYTLEPQPHRKWGYYGSLVMAAANFGTLLGGIVAFALRESLTEQQLVDWGWRVPFLAGILVSVCGMYLRYHCDEIAHHDSTSTDTPPNPIKTAFSRGNRRALLAACLVPTVWSSGFYTSFVWMAEYMETLLQDPVPHAFGVNSASLLLSVCILFPIAGILSDRLGRKFVMTLGGTIFGIVSPFLIWAIGASAEPVVAFFCQCVLGVTLSFWGAPMMAWLVESFSPEARLTSVAIGYNVAQATIGGLAPALATVLFDTMGGSAPGFLLTIVTILGLIGLRCIAPHDKEGLPTTSDKADGVEMATTETPDLGESTMT